VLLSLKDNRVKVLSVFLWIVFASVFLCIHAVSNRGLKSTANQSLPSVVHHEFNPNIIDGISINRKFADKRVFAGTTRFEVTNGSINVFSTAVFKKLKLKALSVAIDNSYKPILKKKNNSSIASSCNNNSSTADTHNFIVPFLADSVGNFSSSIPSTEGVAEVEVDGFNLSIIQADKSVLTVLSNKANCSYKSKAVVLGGNVIVKVGGKTLRTNSLLWYPEKSQFYVDQTGTILQGSTAKNIRHKILNENLEEIVQTAFIER
jgi:hypothetical protein